MSQRVLRNGSKQHTEPCNTHLSPAASLFFAVGVGAGCVFCQWPSGAWQVLSCALGQLEYDNTCPSTLQEELMEVTESAVYSHLPTASHLFALHLQLQLLESLP